MTSQAKYMKALWIKILMKQNDNINKLISTLNNIKSTFKDEI